MGLAIPVNQRAFFTRQFTRVVGSEARKYCSIQGVGSYSVERLPTDAVGTITCTFDGVNADSEIRVFLPDGTEVAGIENCADNQVLSWGVYPAGSANNTVTIRIIHPNYEIKEFTYLSAIGERSLPVQQEIDPWYRNPI